METIDISIPKDWLAGQKLSSDELHEALRLGLTQLRERQQSQQAHRRQVAQALAAAGLSLPGSSAAASQQKLSPSQRQALAERAGAAGPISDLIIEERADRI